MSTTIERERIKNLVKEVLAKFPEHSEKLDEPRPEHLLVNSIRDRHEREFDRDESAKSLITEDDLRGMEPGSRLRVGAKAKFTPLAQDLISDRNIELIVKEERTVAAVVRSVALGSDHGGFDLKEKLKPVLSSLGIQIRDFGTDSPEPVDYPDIALAVARSVAGGNSQIGILIDGAGIGSAMAANKVPGIRAAACYSEKLARNAREHNGANVLTLGSGVTSLDEAEMIVNAFVSTEIAEERHRRRVAKITTIESEYSRTN